MQQSDLAPAADLELPIIEPDAKAFQWHLGDTDVTISRLKTGPALAAAKTVLGYLDKILVAVEKANEGRDLPPAVDGQPDIQAALTGGGMRQTIEIMQALADILEPDELMALAARLMGLSREAIEDAPLEDVLSALCGAIDLNRIPTLMRYVRVLGQKIGLMSRGEA